MLHAFSPGGTTTHPSSEHHHAKQYRNSKAKMSNQVDIKPLNTLCKFNQLESCVGSRSTDRLTDHELRILTLMGTGNTPLEVRKQLGLPANNLTNSLRVIMQKLRFWDRRELREYASQVAQLQVVW